MKNFLIYLSIWSHIEINEEINNNNVIKDFGSVTKLKKRKSVPIWDQWCFLKTSPNSNNLIISFQNKSKKELKITFQSPQNLRKISAKSPQNLRKISDVLKIDRRRFCGDWKVIFRSTRDPFQTVFIVPIWDQWCFRKHHRTQIIS